MHHGNVVPSTHFIEVLQRLVAENPNSSIRVAEIGIDRGATTFEIVKILRRGDFLDLFDMETCALAPQIEGISSESDCTISFFPNSNKSSDSYFWPISKIRLKKTEPHLGGVNIWDAVYLDGSHSFPADAPVTCLLKDMVKINGFIVFDDMYWRMSRSPTCNTSAMRERFTEEQMETPHVEMLVELFVRTDSRFKELTPSNSPRAIFQRMA